MPDTPELRDELLSIYGQTWTAYEESVDRILDALTAADFIEPLITEIYQRGLDEPEAAQLIRRALLNGEPHDA